MPVEVYLVNPRLVRLLPDLILKPGSLDEIRSREFFSFHVLYGRSIGAQFSELCDDPFWKRLT